MEKSNNEDNGKLIDSLADCDPIDPDLCVGLDHEALVNPRPKKIDTDRLGLVTATSPVERAFYRKRLRARRGNWLGRSGWGA